MTRWGARHRTSRQSGAGWTLRVVSGPAAGVDIDLPAGETVLGRVVHPGGLRLQDDSISRRHAVVSVGPNAISVTDEGSTNGTWVNGSRIARRTILRTGDQLQIGETELLVDQAGGRTTRIPPVRPAATATLRTILFTDLVGSTAMAHKLGDELAIEILSFHDRIVRTAIEEHDGREVKHTGDGIMASFHSAAEGVQAAIDIMRAIEAHCTEQPGKDFAVRVGLNAGEPAVAEDGDLFGLAVSLAARLCNAAEDSTILASEAVKVLCLGKDKPFIDRGTRTLKGIDTPVNVCEVPWRVAAD